MQNPPPPEVIARFGVQLGITSQLYLGLLARLVEPYDLTYPQFALLVHLSRRTEPARISDMAQAVDLTQSAVTKAVQKFQGLGLVNVARDSADQRNRRVTMTDLGRQRVGEIQRKFGPAFGGMLNGWASDDIARLTEDLKRLSQWLQASAQVTPPKDG